MQYIFTIYNIKCTDNILKMMIHINVDQMLLFILYLVNTIYCTLRIECQYSI